MSRAIDIETKPVLDYLDKLRRRTNDMRPVMDEIGNTIAENVRMTFHEGRDPYGRPWKPLRLRDGQPLRDTGHLANSIAHRARADSVEIGTNVRYAGVHQYGATIRPKRGRYLVFRDRQGGWHKLKQVRIPARPFLPTDGLPAEWERQVLDVIQSHLGAGGEQ